MMTRRKRKKNEVYTPAIRAQVEQVRPGTELTLDDGPKTFAYQGLETPHYHVRERDVWLPSAVCDKLRQRGAILIEKTRIGRRWSWKQNSTDAQREDPKVHRESKLSPREGNLEGDF